MKTGMTTVLRHRGHGPLHFDILLADGRRCLTWHLDRRQGEWWLRAGAPHRRRYLAYQGPVGGGRGCVRPVWRGRGWYWRVPGGVALRLDACLLWTVRGRCLLVPMEGRGCDLLTDGTPRSVPCHPTTTVRADARSHRCLAPTASPAGQEQRK